MITYKNRLKFISKDLRQNTTPEEKILWSKIRKNQILNIRFYRQKPLDCYIVDFYAPKIKLVIELDGTQHFKKDNIEYDLIRTKILSNQNVIIQRFTNYQINNNLSDVLEKITKITLQLKKTLKQTKI